MALVALLLAAGLVACGSSDSSSSTTTETGAQAQAEDQAGDGASKASDAKSGGEGKPSDEGKSGAGSAANFVPKHHSDSGGGSQDFKTKGGDNSVQEFGEEADASEFHAAAAALHNFLDAKADSNWGAACDYMAKSIIESFEKLAANAQIEGKSCAVILGKLTNPAALGTIKAEAEKANVRSLRTEGEQAFVIYTGADAGAVLAMPMANEDGDWKVAGLAGTPLN